MRGLPQGDAEEDEYPSRATEHAAPPAPLDVAQHRVSRLLCNLKQGEGHHLAPSCSEFLTV